MADKNWSNVKKQKKPHTFPRLLILKVINKDT